MPKRGTKIKPTERRKIQEMLLAGDSPSKVSRVTDRSTSIIYHIRRDLQAGDPRKAEWYLRDHRSALLEAAVNIRACFHDPQMGWDADLTAGKLLWLEGHDWALMPREWVALTTPDFDGQWVQDTIYQQLKEHLAKTQIWVGTYDLRRMAAELETDMALAVIGLGDEFKDG